jgi:hypothetical protein
MLIIVLDDGGSKDAARSIGMLGSAREGRDALTQL